MTTGLGTRRQDRVRIVGSLPWVLPEARTVAGKYIARRRYYLKRNLKFVFKSRLHKTLPIIMPRRLRVTAIHA